MQLLALCTLWVARCTKWLHELQQMILSLEMGSTLSISHLLKKNVHASTIQTQHHSQETSRNKHSQIYTQIIINHNIGKSNDVKHAQAK